MKKLSSLIEGDVILKYQLIPEDLDALVTVKSDEDLRLMFEEYDRHELIGTPRLRTFLFPANPIVLENQMGPMDPQSLEQRYINSINGIVFNPTPPPPSSYRNFRPPAINTGQTIFSINSACSSPNTPPETTIPTTVPEVTNPEITVFRNKLSAMPRARSSPNLCNLGANSLTNHMNPTPISTLNLSIGNQQHPHHHHYHHQNRHQPPPPPAPQLLPQPQPHHIHLHPHPHPHSSSPKPPLDPHPHKNSGQDHLFRQRTNDYYRHLTEHNQHTPPSHYGRPTRTSGHMGYQRSSPYDQYYGNNRLDRTESPPGSPLARSPLQNSYIPKWDSFGGRT